MSGESAAGGGATLVCQKFPLSPEGRAELRPEDTARQFLDKLVTRGLFIDAVRLVAHAMPTRQAVWWACRCVRPLVGPRGVPAVDAAERWVQTPTDDNRRAAGEAAKAADVASPAGCAAMAAFYSGGSLAPPHLPVVAPGEQLTGSMVVAAVLLASVTREAEKAEERFREFLELGLSVAEGRDRWPGDHARPAGA